MSRENIKGGFLIEIIKATIASVIIALSSILLFALILRVSNLSNGAIKTVNQFIKAVSIFVGAITAIKRGKGLIKGAVLGVSFVIIIYLLLGLICGNLTFSPIFLLEILFGLIIGILSGIVSVNVKKDR